MLDQEALLARLPDVVFVVDEDVRLRYVNAAAKDVLGFEPSEWIGRSALDLVHPDDVAVVISSATALQGKRQGTPIEVRVRRGDGSWTWLEIVGADATDVDGVDGLICVARDLTARRMWEVSGDDVARFQQIVQHAASITLLLDRHGTVESVNGAFTRLLGHDPTEVIGHTLVGFASSESAAALATAIHQAITTGEHATCEAAMRMNPTYALAVSPAANMPSRPIRFEIVNLLDDPVVGGLVVTGHDITDLHIAREALERVASHDALTDLSTRAVLLEQMSVLLAAGRSAAVLFIDLDRFKPVNDLLGHEAGDQLLRSVGERLRRLVRPADIVSRVGGDEFVVLAIGVAEQHLATLLAERIERELEAPYIIGAGPVRISASVGVALRTNGSTVAGVLADADIAMYDAKAGRRGEPVRSLPDRRRSSVERRQLADDLAAGLQRNEVVAHFQPIADIGTRRTIAVEALVRWNHPRLGMLQPSAFLDLAADAGLDLMLGDAVLESACATLATMPADLQLCVNLSVTQLAERTLCDRLAVILARHGLDPERLRVEITENATLARRAGGGRVSPEHTLLELCAMGVSLSLDDFGTGYSSLTHVRRYPLSAIKIDRSFVTGVVDHREDRAVIAAVAGLASMLGLQVVGEGVEHIEQVDALRDLGCDAVQGYLISRAMDASALAVWMAGAAADDWFLAELAP
ncbi:MAG: diguanylate cyclase/phosphodiesterase with sensor [Ilumatobacteraceae bacterium]|nr:diguanylate cyclase/phosphodiesterase with sensor [Ilumatobacteraceae bacterium]